MIIINIIIISMFFFTIIKKKNSTTFQNLVALCSIRSLCWKRSHPGFDFSVMETFLFLFPSQVFPTYHIYPPTAPHVAYMQPKANAPSFFMTDELRQVFPLPQSFSCSCSPGVTSDVDDACVSFQELINRHLITMAQIDHSENPGKGCGLNINCRPEHKP